MKCFPWSLINSANEPIAKDNRHLNFGRFVKSKQQKAGRPLGKPLCCNFVAIASNNILLKMIFPYILRASEKFVDQQIILHLMQDLSKLYFIVAKISHHGFLPVNNNFYPRF